MRKLISAVAGLAVVGSALLAQVRPRSRGDAPAKLSDVEAIREMVVALDKRVTILEAANPAPQAAKKSIVSLGMTLPQIRRAIGNEGELLTAEEGRSVYKWSGIEARYYVADAPASAGSIIGEFDGDKLVSIRFGRGGSTSEQR